MSTTQQLFALSLDQVTTALLAGGNKRTMLVQGHIGTGKSSLLKTLAQQLPDHHACYFDCTTKDLGDIALPNIAKLDATAGYVEFLTNEELGMHLNKPIILMIDEYGKANPAVKNGLLRVMLERKLAGRELHPDSIVFATTNLGAEGVGDLLPPHARNRVTIITVRKPTSTEWIEWGIENGIDHTLLGWVRDNPQVLQSFDEVTSPADNPYIFHPREQRVSFVTPRSLEAASDWLKQRHSFDAQTLNALLIGTIGERGAMDLSAFVELADQLPTLKSIQETPEEATVPSSASAICMVVYRALQAVDATWIENWMVYLNRLPKEAQGMFVNGVRATKYNSNRRNIVMASHGFGTWARSNAHLFAADV